ncbi:hypothetical protein CBB2_3506 [Clostridium botulinum]|nr:hypothetical protein [Clostridium botulinum]BAQ36509.1 hypothetical protein CBB2_3506 [Clostridium botulinum]
MDKKNKEALIYRLNCIRKYAEEGKLDDIKKEIEKLLDEIKNYDLVVPF